MSQLADALASIHLKILKYDPDKQRPVGTSRGTMGVEKFCKLLQKELGPKAIQFPEVWEAFHDTSNMERLIESYAEENDLTVGRREVQVPAELDGLTLNCNMVAKGREDRFFLTYPDDTISPIAGEFWLLVHGMNHAQAVAKARNVVPEYMPRRPPGVSEIQVEEGKSQTVFNIYVPPMWKRLDKEKRKRLPDELPELFEKLVSHLFPLPEEREFFYAWLHDSLFKRSFTFLILCGAPGTGKNRLKLVMRALHGHLNTVDGKKSTLTERFNSQLGESTLAWFDELHYDADMENTMKELQNDSISIERKGVDATRATRIYASIVISNNKPRDNYIAFDARKFAPLKITSHRLEASMAPDEIDAITQKVEDPTSDTFDVEFIAQIAKWIKRHGASKKWPHLEYRGPMFWTLAHTSMTRWQKKAVMLLLEPNNRQSRAEHDPKKGFLWSVMADKSMRKHGDKSLQFPDHTSVQAFFEVFRDAKGRKAFETEGVPNSIIGDFYVRPIFKKTEIITEASVIEQRAKENGKTPKEKYDL